MEETIFSIATKISEPITLAGFFAAIVFFIFRKAINKKTVTYLFILALVAMILGAAGWYFKNSNNLEFTVSLDGNSIDGLTVTARNANASEHTNRDGRVTLDIYKRQLDTIRLEFTLSLSNTYYDTSISTKNFPNNISLNSSLFRLKKNFDKTQLVFTIYKYDGSTPFPGIEAKITNIGVAEISNPFGKVTLSFNYNPTIDILKMQFIQQNSAIFDTAVSIKNFPSFFVMPYRDEVKQKTFSLIPFNSALKEQIQKQYQLIYSQDKPTYKISFSYEENFSNKDPSDLKYNGGNVFIIVNDCRFIISGVRVPTFDGTKQEFDRMVNSEIERIIDSKCSAISNSINPCL